MLRKIIVPLIIYIIEVIIKSILIALLISGIGIATFNTLTVFVIVIIFVLSKVHISAKINNHEYNRMGMDTHE